MAGSKYRTRLRRLSKQLDPQTPSHPWGVPPERVREQFLEQLQLEELSREAGRRAREIRAARERGEELSDPLGGGVTGLELEAHIISYADEDGNLDDVPAELVELYEARRVTVPHDIPNAEEYQEAFHLLSSLGLSLAIDEYLHGEER